MKTLQLDFTNKIVYYVIVVNVKLNYVNDNDSTTT